MPPPPLRISNGQCLTYPSHIGGGMSAFQVDADRVNVTLRAIKLICKRQDIQIKWKNTGVDVFEKVKSFCLYIKSELQGIICPLWQEQIED